MDGDGVLTSKYETSQPAWQPEDLLDQKGRPLSQGEALRSYNMRVLSLYTISLYEYAESFILH